MASDRDAEAAMSSAREGELAQAAAFLATLEIFSSLSDADLDVLARYTSRETLMPGEPITCGDDRVTDVYAIVRGQVEVSDRTFIEDGHVHTEPHLLGPGDVIVWSAILDHNDYVASTEVELGKLPGPKLLDFLRTRQHAGIAVMTEIDLAARLRREAAIAHGSGNPVDCPIAAHRQAKEIEEREYDRFLRARDVLAEATVTEGR